MPEALVFDVQRGSLVDGPGIRTVVFFKGCNLRCPWCHNPESWSERPQLLFYESRCLRCGACERACPVRAIAPDLSVSEATCLRCGACAAICPSGARTLCGRYASTEALLAEVLEDRPFYEASGGGVTFSGGECMLQPEPLHALLSACKAEGVHTAVDTAGDLPFSQFERMLPVTDLFLYDIKCMDAALHQGWTGVDNARILRNYRALQAAAPEKLWVRVPVIPGFNADNGEMERIRAFLREHPPARAEYLPYHGLGEAKMRALGQKSFRPAG